MLRVWGEKDEGQRGRYLWEEENDIAFKSHQPGSFIFHLALKRADINESASVFSVGRKASRTGRGMRASVN